MYTIYCVPEEKGKHSFYLKNNKEKYYLFSQPYRKGVARYFGGGVSIDKAIDYSKAKLKDNYDTALVRTMDKIPSHVKYIEKEYGIKVFRRSN